VSHIAVDLKVIEVHGPAVARTMGEPVALTVGGLTLLWHRCWSTKTDTISRIGLGGVFGLERIDLRIEAMVDAGFLEPLTEGFRVRGAAKYLRILEGLSRGGHAAKSNLKRGASKPADSRPTAGEGAGGVAGREPGEVPGSMPALTPSTEHRAPNTEHLVLPPKAKRKPKQAELPDVVPPPPPREPSRAEVLHRRFLEMRQEHLEVLGVEVAADEVLTPAYVNSVFRKWVDLFGPDAYLPKGAEQLDYRTGAEYCCSRLFELYFEEQWPAGCTSGRDGTGEPQPWPFRVLASEKVWRKLVAHEWPDIAQEAAA